MYRPVGWLISEEMFVQTEGAVPKLKFCTSPLVAMTQVQSKASPCSGKSSTTTGFSPPRLRFTPDQIVHIHSFIHAYIH